MRPEQEPTIRHEDGPTGGKIVEHPSFGQISISRVEGGQVLYGSDFKHHRCMRLSIKQSYLRRDLSNDWAHSRGLPLIEIDMSEAQWAEFVSSVSVYSGVQCTLRYINGEAIPAIPSPVNRQEQFHGEATERLKDGMNQLSELEQAIKDLKLPEKTKVALVRQLNSARAQFGSNLKFVADQFSEHMERATTKARTEVNAYALHQFTRLGLQADALPLALPEPTQAGAGPADNQ